MTEAKLLAVSLGVISTPMPLAGHDQFQQYKRDANGISTPMPLAGHDLWRRSSGAFAADFYSHAPRGA